MINVLEVNVDDLHTGGVYSLVKNVIQNNVDSEIKIDIAAIERFQKKNNVDFLKQYNCEVYYIGSEGSKWKKQIIVYRNLKELLTRNHYNCVHIHADTSNKLLVSGMAAKAVGVNRIIFHSHSSGVDGNHRTIKKIAHRICRPLLPHIGNVFVACSDHAAKWMFPKLDFSKITIINNGIDLEKFRFNADIREKTRKDLGINNDELLLGHVGRFLYQKNHEYLIEIMKEVRNQDIRAKLLLVGEGERYQEIYELAKNNNLLNDIIFYGSSNKVNELMMAMDVFLLPSHFEGLPIVGVEAQATGLPVIFSDTISKEAALSNSVVFLPIKQDNVDKWIETIVTIDKESLTRMNNYENIKEKGYDIKNTVNSFLNVYRKH